MNGTLTDPATDIQFHVSTDVVIFAVRSAALQVLLRRREPAKVNECAWALPGTCAAEGETLDDCVQQVLRTQTGLGDIHDIYIEQLATFALPGCVPEAREISVVYYALVSRDPGADCESGRRGNWWVVDRLPEMYLDHGRIVRAARERLEAKLEYSTVGFQLLPELFTLSELQCVYESVSARPVDKRNFRKRILALEHVQPTEHKRRDGCHRPARLYRYTARDTIHFLK